ncbi:unnamed protein product [Mesocestoides corti]|uniref:Uncharacterized protein n=1 Tax=Mesocestoides corti TaxID=53468 RepID=A0A0R3U5G1_MESCO|nr:unnamed protein product [Mesocestoides corti]
MPFVDHSNPRTIDLSGYSDEEKRFSSSNEMEKKTSPSSKPEMQLTPIPSNNKETITTTRYGRRVHCPVRYTA